jgi:hypothetical protein
VKLFYTGPFVNAEMLVMMLEKHGIIATQSFVDPALPDDGDLGRPAQVCVPEADYDRATNCFTPSARMSCKSSKPQHPNSRDTSNSKQPAPMPVLSFARVSHYNLRFEYALELGFWRLVLGDYSVRVTLTWNP